MKTICILSLLIGISFTISAIAQVTVGSEESPEKGALLDIKTQKSDDNNVTSDKGSIVLPRIGLTNLSKLYPVLGDNAPMERKGMIVYNVNTDVEANIHPGIYEWTGTQWMNIENSATLKQPWYNISTKQPSTAKTQDSYVLSHVVIGGKDISLVDQNMKAGLSVLSGNASLNGMTIGQGGIGNVQSLAFGNKALSKTSSGAMSNTAIGHLSLQNNTIGINNTAIGNNTLSSLTTGTNNTAIGFVAGNLLSTGSYNLFIGDNSDVLAGNEANDYQINIGNLIYGKHGTSLSDLGQIAIGKRVPQASLHVAGNMKLNLDKVPSMRGFTSLIADSNGRIGAGSLLPIPTLNALIQSTTAREFTSNGEWVNMGTNSRPRYEWVETAEMGDFNNGEKMYLSFMDNASELISNTLITTESNGQTITISEDVSVELSGYVFFQVGILYGSGTGVTGYDHPFATYADGNNNYLVVSLYLEHIPKGSTTGTIITSGSQIWYGANTSGTIKIISLQPLIQELKAGDRLRWYVKKEDGSVRVNRLGSNGENIKRPAGGKYSKGISILAFSK